jgi:NTE family protein
MTEEDNHRGRPQRIALAMQGSGAIGAFQASVIETLHDANITVDARCGSSIGAIQRRHLLRQRR